MRPSLDRVSVTHQSTLGRHLTDMSVVGSVDMSAEAREPTEHMIRQNYTVVPSYISYLSNLLHYRKISWIACPRY